MPPRIHSETRSMVLALRPEGLSHQKISDRLKALGVGVSAKSVGRILERDAKKKSGNPSPRKRLPKHQVPSVRTKRIIKKVDKLISSPNPPTQREIGRRLGISEGSVRNILKKDLEADQMKKTKVHQLTDKMGEQRLLRGELFLKYLSRRKLRYLFTMDEMMINTSDVSGKTSFYYRKNRVKVPDDWKILPRQSWPKQIMVAMGICWRGQSQLYVVPPNTKVDADAFIKLILRPMIEKDIPRLYGNEAKKVTFHMDSAPAHVAKKTVEWLQSHKVKYIPKEHWMSNSPDLAPMDYAINSIFKRILKCSRAVDAKQLARVGRRNWKKMSLKKIQNALKVWKFRVEKMIRNRGFQIDHVSDDWENVE